MNKKISIGVCISLIFIACTVTFVVTWTVSLNMYNGLLPGALGRDTISAKLQEIDTFIRNNFYGEISDEDVEIGIFSGYIEGIGDQNTVYMTPEQYRQQIAEESGQLITAGIRTEAEGSGYLIITHVYAGSSAESLGVQINDMITDIEDTSVLSVGADVAARLLEGDEHVRVKINVLRDGETLEFSLIRQSIAVVSVEADVVNEVGFARIDTFNALTDAQFDTALKTFADANVRAILIDLRDNDSDYYTPVINMTNALVGAGTIARSEHRGGVVRDFIVTDDNRALPAAMQGLPIIVLVNAQTAGAGELFAAILRTHSDAQIVGVNSAGNTFLTETQQLKDESAIRVTVARIMLTGGDDYAGAGLSPNFAVDLGAETISYNINDFRDIELSEIPDLQIRRAFEIINTAAY
ncbi:MAG: S41 family peptidase [Oscillospiraceae bacterium]|nr:S41 family peptidase [Oscillospiraceae bacterium]